MTRCKNDVLINKIGSEKLQKTTETEFVRHNYLPDCRRILASKYMNEITATYNKFAIPDNQFECVREGCVNSGTLYNEGVATQYKAQWDAVEFAGGVITFYAIGSEGTATVKISDTATGTNSDVYTVDLSKIENGADGYKAVVVDLSKTPGSTTGSGWVPNHVAAYITITITPAEEDTASEIGISSIAVFDSMEDFETSATVVLACLSQLGSSWEFEPVEATCFGNGGIDDEAIDNFEKTLTAKALTPNYHVLNPLYGKGDATTGWDSMTVEKTVEAGTGDDAGYGVIVLPDKYPDECGFVSVARADNCNVTDAHLVELKVPSRVTVDEGHFFVIDQENGSAKIYVNSSLVGQTLVVRYPQSVEVEEYVYDVDNVRDTRYRWSYTRTYTDGVKYRFVFDNVIITGFPDEITDEESEFEFTVTIQKDATGRFGRAYKIIG